MDVWKPDIGKLGKEFKGDAKLILEAIKDIDLRPGIKLILTVRILNE